MSFDTLTSFVTATSFHIDIAWRRHETRRQQVKPWCCIATSCHVTLMPWCCVTWLHAFVMVTWPWHHRGPINAMPLEHLWNTPTRRAVISVCVLLNVRTFVLSCSLTSKVAVMLPAYENRLVGNRGANLLFYIILCFNLELLSELLFILAKWCLCQHRVFESGSGLCVRKTLAIATDSCLFLKWGR